MKHNNILLLHLIPPACQWCGSFSAQTICILHCSATYDMALWRVTSTYVMWVCGLASSDCWLPVRCESTGQSTGERDPLHRNAATVGHSPDGPSA